MTPLERAIEALKKLKKKATARQERRFKGGTTLDWMWSRGEEEALKSALRTLRRIQKSARGEP